MNDELRAANIMGHVALAQLEMHGMIAENQDCDARGWLPEYNEDAFIVVHHALKIKLAQHMVI